MSMSNLLREVVGLKAENTVGSQRAYWFLRDQAELRVLVPRVGDFVAMLRSASGEQITEIDAAAWIRQILISVATGVLNCTALKRARELGTSPRLISVTTPSALAYDRMQSGDENSCFTRIILDPLPAVLALYDPKWRKKDVRRRLLQLWFKRGRGERWFRDPSSNDSLTANEVVERVLANARTYEVSGAAGAAFWLHENKKELRRVRRFLERRGIFEHDDKTLAWGVCFYQEACILRQNIHGFPVPSSVRGAIPLATAKELFARASREYTLGRLETELEILSAEVMDRDDLRAAARKGWYELEVALQNEVEKLRKRIKRADYIKENCLDDSGYGDYQRYLLKLFKLRSRWLFSFLNS